MSAHTSQAVRARQTTGLTPSGHNSFPLQVVLGPAILIPRLENHWVATVLLPWKLKSEEFYQRDGVRKHEQRNREIRRQKHGKLKHDRCVRLAAENVQWRRHGKEH